LEDHGVPKRELGDEAYYEPRYAVARGFARIFPIAGWIIIAALAAALTGLIELKGHRKEH
jgi:hypothetical protein